MKFLISAFVSYSNCIGVHVQKLSLSFDFQTYHFDFVCDAEKCDRNEPTKKKQAVYETEGRVKERRSERARKKCAQLRSNTIGTDANV